MTRVAVVGHVEWMEFARVPALPAPGDIVHATEVWEEAGGGGAVAAVQLAKLAGGAVFFTALTAAPARLPTALPTLDAVSATASAALERVAVTPLPLLICLPRLGPLDGTCREPLSWNNAILYPHAA